MIQLYCNNILNNFEYGLYCGDRVKAPYLQYIYDKVYIKVKTIIIQKYIGVDST